MTEVDSGMLETLELIKTLGLRTTYSCQGSQTSSAYILLPTSDAVRLEEILANGEAVNLFSDAWRLARYAIYVRKSDKVIHAIRHFEKVVDTGSAFEIRRLNDNLWGRRTCYRWPVEASPQLLLALRATRGG